ncbi:MAG: signal peptide peptidase SppA [Enhydrobacter sp.]|nr:MAG: signal peptide peptidase SppA [Enhydrobacter sp.]
MWRFIVGLLATIGFLALALVGAAVYFAVSGPFGAKTLPSPIVLSLDLRKLPPEAGSAGWLGLLQPSLDIADTIDLLDRAADDPRVAGLFVEIGDSDAGLARVQELRQAITRFRGKGKFAVGFAESLGGDASHFADYYLAASLEQIWLQPSGGFSVAGIAVEAPFLKGALDRLGVQVEGGKRYEYKSAPEMFTEAGFSRPARENLQQLLDSLYGQFIDQVAREREIPAEWLRGLIDGVPYDSRRALAERLVDKLGYRADALAEVRRRAGDRRDPVRLEDYAADDARPRPSGEVIALVRASGAIVSGSGESDPLGDESLATADKVVDALDEASRASDVRAIVLRVDSPGGTYPAADAIAEAVARARSTGKPIVVSMGDIAASGGYLASVRADAIVAQPTTITGSIGVFTMWPVAAELLRSLGIQAEKVSAGANAGMLSVFRPPTPAQKAAIDRELDRIYADFTRQVGEARGLDGARLDAAARGRVFSGIDAKRAGLVDELGGLPLAVAIAKAKAGIDEVKPVQLRRYPAESNRWERLADRLLGMVSTRTELRMPPEMREALARLGVPTHPGDVRLPPLPPLWR